MRPTSTSSVPGRSTAHRSAPVVGAAAAPTARDSARSVNTDRDRHDRTERHPWAPSKVPNAAAIPVMEVLVVIPAGILAGLAPVPVLLLAFVGNLRTVAAATTLGLGGFR